MRLIPQRLDPRGRPKPISRNLKTANPKDSNPTPATLRLRHHHPYPTWHPPRLLFVFIVIFIVHLHRPQRPPHHALNYQHPSPTHRKTIPDLSSMWCVIKYMHKFRNIWHSAPQESHATPTPQPHPSATPLRCHSRTPRCHSRSLLSGNPYWIMPALIRLTRTRVTGLRNVARRLIWASVPLHRLS